MKNWLCQLTALVLFTAGAQAVSLHFNILSPTGGQRGTEIELTCTGSHLKGTKGVLFYTPGLEATDIQDVDENTVKMKVKIAADCGLGEHSMRLWTASGISELRTFWVGPFPVVESKSSTIKDKNSKELNNIPAQAQLVPLNSTVTGVIKSEQTDYYEVELKKGQRLSVDVEGLRLASQLPTTRASIGNGVLDPYLTISKADGPVLARCDDNVPGRHDPLLSLIAPEDGKYIVALRDATYGGNTAGKYRMHIGSFPLPMTVYPLGGRAGSEVSLTFLGDASGPIAKTVTLPAADTEKFRLVAEDNNLPAPEPTAFRVVPFGNVMEAEPNNDVEHATDGTQKLPLAFNGIISEKGDVDVFKFKATKGQALDVTVWARRLLSPLDSVIKIRNAKGSTIANNDDVNNGPDSYLRFNPPETGDYFLSISDHMKRGGPTFSYRIEVTPVVPELSVTFPEYEQASQRQQAVTVPRGSRLATWFRVKRSEVNEETIPVFSGLPAGITATVVPVPTNTDVVPVIFEAAADAPIDAKLCDIGIETTKPEGKIRGHFGHDVELIYGQNNALYYKTHVDKVAFSVGEEVPFTVTQVQPKVPLLQSGQMNFKVMIERKGDFKGQVRVSTVWSPPGISSQSSITIPEGKNEGVFTLNANSDAPLRTWKFAVSASSDTGRGTVRTGSQFADIEVAKPFVDGKLERVSVEQGQSVTMVCKLTPVRPFEGTAKVQLLGLPNQVTAPDVEITSKDEEIRFQIATSKASPPGQHKGLFCQITVTQNGEPLVANTGRDGILRIDPVEKPAEKTSDGKKSEKPPQK